MRIAYYVPRADFLEPYPGGDSVMARSLLSGLRARGHEVRIVSRLNPFDFLCGRVPARRLLTEAIAVHKAMKPFSPDAWLVYSPSADRPDLFGWWHRPKGYVLFGAHAPGKRLPLADWRATLLTLAHRRSLARASKIAGWRPRSIERLRSFGIAEDRLCLLLPAAETWDRMPSREEARRRLGLPQEAPVILCAGRFSAGRPGGRPKKTEMMLDLIAAVAQLPPDAVLLLVGDNGRGRERLELEAARVEPGGRVRVVVSMDHADIKWYYAACDIYAYPHPKDTPWVSVLEAQYCARPVVTLHTKSAELTIEPGRTGLLAKDLGEFRTHLATLVSDRALRESMGQAASEYVRTHHSIETRIGQIEELLLGREPVISARSSDNRYAQPA